MEFSPKQIEELEKMELNFCTNKINEVLENHKEFLKDKNRSSFVWFSITQLVHRLNKLSGKYVA